MVKFTFINGWFLSLWNMYILVWRLRDWYRVVIRPIGFWNCSQTSPSLFGWLVLLFGDHTATSLVDSLLWNHHVPPTHLLLHICNLWNLLKNQQIQLAVSYRYFSLLIANEQLCLYCKTSMMQYYNILNYHFSDVTPCRLYCFSKIWSY